MAHAALVRRHVGFELVLPLPEQPEAAAIPDYGIEGREEAQVVVHVGPRGSGVFALRPEPQDSVDFGMGVARSGVLLDLPHLWSQMRHSTAQQSAQITEAGRGQRRVELDYLIQ